MKQSTFLRKALRTLVADGWTIERVDGEQVTGVEAAIAECKAVDMANVTLGKGDQSAWLLVVWQGPDASYDEGEEIIADHTVNLEAVLAPLYTHS
jgi:hypothetical protein